MQQVRMDHTTVKFMDSEICFRPEERNTIKRKHQHLQQIQPWLEEPDTNPFINLRSKQLQTKKQTPRVKRLSSLSINHQWRSIEKVVQNRESKILPIMDVGQLNNIKKTYSSPKLKAKSELQPHSQRSSTKRIMASQILLPSVKRQLAIERKLFLMKSTSNNSPSSSPIKSGRIRKIIESHS